MNKVITIHLRGKAYNVEENGYNSLRTYLDTAATKLSGNPDKDEIIADLEQAIADKCTTYLSAQKDVVTFSEIEKVLKEMGPVEELSGENSSNTADSKENTKNKTSSGPRKLYQVREGAWISGVCNGLAIFFDIDVTIVRLIFIILAILTHGAWIGVYILMMIFVPHATTPDQKAAAFGTSGMNAQDFINRAKENFNDFKNSDNIKEWKNKWKEQRKNWRYEKKQYYREYGRPPLWWLLQLIGIIFWLVVIGVVFSFIYHYALNNHISLHDYMNYISNKINNL